MCIRDRSGISAADVVESGGLAAVVLGFAPDAEGLVVEIERLLRLAELHMDSADVVESEGDAAAIADFAPQRQRLVVVVETLLLLSCLLYTARCV